MVQPNTSKRSETPRAITGVASVCAVVLIAAVSAVSLWPQDAAPGYSSVKLLAASSPKTVQPLEKPFAPEAPPVAIGAVEVLGTGQASYYGAELAGNRTASGERFDPEALTAAHRTLPLGSRVRVVNERTGASVVVRVNDRGPFVGDRVLDVSEGAAREIGMVRRGTARVRLELLPRRRG